MFANVSLSRPPIGTSHSNPLVSGSYAGTPLRKEQGSFPAPQGACQSMREVLMRPLNRIDTLSQALLRSLAPSQSSVAKPPAAPPISAFIETDQALASAVNMAKVHQEKQREIDALTQEILELERDLRDKIRFLVNGRNALGEILRESEESLEAIDQAAKGSVPYDVILGYASNIANFTSAPPTMELPSPNTQMSVSAMSTFRPPFPTEEMMRRGKMNEEPPLGSLGETTEIGAVAPSIVSTNAYQEGDLAVPGPGLATQYSTYASRHRTTQDSAPAGDLFDLDLNPDF
ncbi:vitamin-D-receptor interacting mediator subunit 4-domain-containing protein [Cantharellus anzutake]|uniref:vitamin-D-receptor interacting mediator subunit 4-domain-containing protein n=1 Tax=Cantharellus anzutake TaxID=1750568 RepID=UPI001903FAEC|nr:vitamin-D-receptor interacting mediator subunit 4-domain-containing protein [Cantharellus anzutake]KAF8324321.1 vitamin-D-receptor interacting mediator subunit 4-domain-containing protein [Cantharellus anzutake]